MTSHITLVIIIRRVIYYVGFRSPILFRRERAYFCVINNIINVLKNNKKKHWNFKWNVTVVR